MQNEVIVLMLEIIVHFLSQKDDKIKNYAVGIGFFITFMFSLQSIYSNLIKYKLINNMVKASDFFHIFMVELEL